MLRRIDSILRFCSAYSACQQTQPRASSRLTIKRGAFAIGSSPGGATDSTHEVGDRELAVDHP